MLTWQLPASGWVKVNVDGSVSHCHLRALVGGVIRGPSGGLLVGFTMATYMAGIYQIEARAVLEVLQLAWEKGFRRVEVESDNAMLIKSLQSSLAIVNNVKEIRMIHKYCFKNWRINFRHFQRGNNKVVDCLTKVAEGDLDQLMVLEEPSIFVREFLDEDISLSLLVKGVKINYLQRSKPCFRRCSSSGFVSSRRVVDQSRCQVCKTNSKPHSEPEKFAN
ncbi:hypothetical protein J1N35_034246 [Gossypium stocksii]|uniref:RNase H type-1 domain-containing protein n=1 Tax=Gossypium stocksii TaxID=47602 RepID=A0A9D3ZP24_9ROSI|nr:hypothetical protein J1N35_034246 [Gossypium stocksii]